MHFFFSLFKERLPTANAVSPLGQKLSHLVCTASDTCQRQEAMKRPQRHGEGAMGPGRPAPALGAAT